MQIQRVTQIAGVTEKCVPGAGATPSCRIAASPSARSSLPPPALKRTNSGLKLVPNSVQTSTESGPELVPARAERSTRLGLLPVPEQDLNQYLS
jgi:hypothetical protein